MAPEFGSPTSAPRPENPLGDVRSTQDAPLLPTLIASSSASTTTWPLCSRNAPEVDVTVEVDVAVSTGSEGGGDSSGGDDGSAGGGGAGGGGEAGGGGGVGALPFLWPLLAP